MNATGKSLLLVLALGAAAAPAFAQDVFVNGVRLDDRTRQALEQTYGVPVAPGRYLSLIHISEPTRH